MAVELTDFCDRVRAELGDDAGQLITDEHIQLWVNDGKNRLGAIKPLSGSITWAAEDASVALATGYVSLSHIRISSDTLYLPPYEIWNTTLYFIEDDGASVEGSATVYYLGYYADIDADNSSTLPPAGDQACVSWVCHRFFRRLANSRSEYRRYATLMGQNGVSVDDLRELSAEYLQDFNDARAALEIPGGMGFTPFYC